MPAVAGLCRLLALRAGRPGDRLELPRPDAGIVAGLYIRSDRRWRFDAAPEAVWAAIVDVDSYRSWWPWLTGLDATGLEPGAEWRCTVQPPMPYRLRFTIQLGTIEPTHLAEATVGGDIEGHARVTIGPAGEGCEVRLTSALAPANPFLRGVARVARPLVRFGHDWVLDTGAAQFRRRALR